MGVELFEEVSVKNLMNFLWYVWRNELVCIRIFKFKENRYKENYILKYYINFEEISYRDILFLKE